VRSCSKRRHLKLALTLKCDIQTKVSKFMHLVRCQIDHGSGALHPSQLAERGRLEFIFMGY
jgi:hypothetical protein